MSAPPLHQAASSLSSAKLLQSDMLLNAGQYCRHFAQKKKRSKIIFSLGLSPFPVIDGVALKLPGQVYHCVLGVDF